MVAGGSANSVGPPITTLKRCASCKCNLEANEKNWFFRSASSKYSPGKAYGPCRECRARAKTKHPNRPHGLVPVGKVYVLMRELRDRCGSVEAAAEASGINENTVRGVCERKRAKVNKQTVRLLVLALDERRRHDRRNGASPRFLAARQAQAQIEDRMNRLAGY
jgi:hypothetical protein